MTDTFHKFNNKDSSIYKQSLKIQKEFIDKKLDTSKQNVFHNKTKLSGSIHDITEHCVKTATTLIKNFFKNCKLPGFHDRTCVKCKKKNC